MSLIRWILGWFVILIGYYAFANVCGVIAGDATLIINEINPDPMDYVFQYLFADGLIYVGSLIAGAKGGYKPTFTSDGGALFGWICILLLFPIVHIFMCSIRLIKFIFRCIFCRGSRGGNRRVANHYEEDDGPAVNANDGRVRSAVKQVCYRESGNVNILPSADVYVDVKPSFISHSITVDVQVNATVNGSTIQSEYEAQNIKTAVADYAQNVVNRLESQIKSAIEDVEGPRDAWGIRVGGSYNIDVR